MKQISLWDHLDLADVVSHENDGKSIVNISHLIRQCTNPLVRWMVVYLIHVCISLI